MTDFCDLASPMQDHLPISALQGDGLVVLKATEGATYTNPQFVTWAHQARALGLRVGGYHFARPGDPVAQATRFLTVTAGLIDWPILDLEVPVGNAQSFANAFASTVGPFGWLYSGPSYCSANGHLVPPPGWQGWLANYGVSAPWIPLGWTGRLAAWQYTSSTVIAGVTVDRSHLYIAPEDDMPAPNWTQDQWNTLYNNILYCRNILGPGADPGGASTLMAEVGQIGQRLDTQTQAVVAAVKDALAAAPASGGGLTDAQLEAAVVKALMAHPLVPSGTVQ